MNYCSPTLLLHVSSIYPVFYIFEPSFCSVWVQVIMRWFCTSPRQFDLGVSPLLIVICIHENEDVSPLPPPPPPREREREREGEGVRDCL